MKNRCYPKKTYTKFIIISIAMAIVSVGILAFMIYIKRAIVVLALLLTLFLTITSFIVAIYNMQYFYFDRDEIIVKSLFGTIVRLNINKVCVVVKSLPNYDYEKRNLFNDWICIYDESIDNKNLYKFRSGCSNSKDFKRIQILYNDNNVKIIEKYMNIKIYKNKKR